MSNTDLMIHYRHAKNVCVAIKYVGVYLISLSIIILLYQDIKGSFDNSHYTLHKVCNSIKVVYVVQAIPLS